MSTAIETPAMEIPAMETEVAQETIGIYRHVFAKPFVWEDKTYHEIEFNFEKLTGRDMLAIENEMRVLGITAVAPAFSSDFLCRLAAKAASIASDVIMGMRASDFHRITSRARSFLLRSE